MADGKKANRRHRHLVTMLALLVVTVAGCGGDADLDTDDTVAPGPQAPGLGAVDQATTTSTPSGGAPIPGATATTEPPETGSTRPGSSSTTGAPTTTVPTSSSSTSSTTTTTTTTTATTSTTVAAPSGPFVRIGKDFYRFTPDDCYVFDGADVLINGIGEAPDGSPVWVQFDANTNSGIWAMRIDIGTDDPFEEMDDNWVAGLGAADDMVVTVDGQLVTATGTFVSGGGHPDTEGEFEAECS